MNVGTYVMTPPKATPQPRSVTIGTPISAVTRQHEQRRADAIDDHERRRGEGHRREPSEQEAATAEAVEEPADRDGADQRRDAGRAHHDADRALRTAERAHVQRQEEERRERQEE